jgi:hypothetical protein
MRKGRWQDLESAFNMAGIREEQNIQEWKRVNKPPVI